MAHATAKESNTLIIPRRRILRHGKREAAAVVDAAAVDAAVDAAAVDAAAAEGRPGSVAAEGSNLELAGSSWLPGACCCECGSGEGTTAIRCGSGIHTRAMPQATAEVHMPARYGARIDSSDRSDPMVGQMMYVALPRPRRLAMSPGRSACGKMSAMYALATESEEEKKPCRPRAANKKRKSTARAERQ